MISSEDIKEFAYSIGAEKCGVANVDSFRDAPNGFRPKDIYKDCQSAIVFLKQMPTEIILADNPIPYTNTAFLLYSDLDRIGLDICRFFQKHGKHAIPIPADNPYLYWDEKNKRGQGIISLRHSAYLAGLGVLGKNTLLINDFIAQAFACISKPGQEAMGILEGDRDPVGTIAIIGPGTGLGKAALIHHEAGYTPMPSEGGHAAFPFSGAREMEFAEFLLAKESKKSKDGYITLDSVITGRGLAYLHEFRTGEAVSPEHIESDAEAFGWAARFLGRATRDFALETLATGGLFISGGVAARNPSLVRSEEFRQEFLLSSKMQHVLERIPVSLITDQDAGLWGAAQCSINALKAKTV